MLVIRAQEDWSIARECVRLSRQQQTVSAETFVITRRARGVQNPVYFALRSSYYPRIAFHPPYLEELSWIRHKP